MNPTHNQNMENASAKKPMDRAKRMKMQPQLIEKLHAILCTEAQCDASECAAVNKFLSHVEKCDSMDCKVPLCLVSYKIVEVLEKAMIFDVLDTVQRENDEPGTAIQSTGHIANNGTKTSAAVEESSQKTVKVTADSSKKLKVTSQEGPSEPRSFLFPIDELASKQSTVNQNSEHPNQPGGVANQLPLWWQQLASNVPPSMGTLPADEEMATGFSKKNAEVAPATRAKQLRRMYNSSEHRMSAPENSGSYAQAFEGFSAPAYSTEYDRSLADKIEGLRKKLNTLHHISSVKSKVSKLQANGTGPGTSGSMNKASTQNTTMDGNAPQSDQFPSYTAEASKLLNELLDQIELISKPTSTKASVPNYKSSVANKNPPSSLYRSNPIVGHGQRRNQLEDEQDMLEGIVLKIEDMAHQLSVMSTKLYNFCDTLDDFILDIDDELYDLEANNWYSRGYGRANGWNNTTYAPSATLAGARPFGSSHQMPLYASYEQQRGYGYGYPNESYSSRGLGWRPYVNDSPYYRYIPQGAPPVSGTNQMPYTAQGVGQSTYSGNLPTVYRICPAAYYGSAAPLATPGASAYMYGGY